MKKYLLYTVVFLVTLLSACKRDGLWNQESTLSDKQKGIIMGNVIDKVTSLPVKGVKVLVERRVTNGDAAYSYVDTLSTNTEGNFQLAVPFPNIVRVSIKDTIRYERDYSAVEILQHKEYPLRLQTEAKFGTSALVATVVNSETNQILPGIKVALEVRETTSDAYSIVDTLLSDAQGRVYFPDLAFPVYFKTSIAEKEDIYTYQHIEGRIQTKNEVNITLKTQAKFGSTNLRLSLRDFIKQTALSNVHVSLQYKSLLDDEFSPATDITTNNNGEIVWENKVYPGQLKIAINNGQGYLSAEVYTFNISDENAFDPILVSFMSSTAYFGNLNWTFSGSLAKYLSSQFLALTDGESYSTSGPKGLTSDSYGNVFIADGHRILRIDRDGKTSNLTGDKNIAGGSNVSTNLRDARFNAPWGLATDAQGHIYVAEKDGHRIRKIILNRADYTGTVETFLGDGTAQSVDGTDLTVKLMAPISMAIDEQNKIMYFSEAGLGSRVRKVNLISKETSTIIGTGNVSGVGIIGAGNNELPPLSTDMVNIAAIGLSHDNNTLFIAQNGSAANNSGLFKYSLTDHKLYKIINGIGGNFYRPIGLHVLDNDVLLVANWDTGNNGNYASWMRLSGANATANTNG